MARNRGRVRSLRMAAGWLFGMACTLAPAWAVPSSSGLVVGGSVAADSRDAVQYVIQRSDTLSRIFERHGIDPREAVHWSAAVRRVAKSAHLRPNHLLTLQFDAFDRLHRLQYEIDDESHVVVESRGNRLVTRRDPRPVTVTVVGAQGIIEQSFYRAAMRSAVPDQVISQMADILGWEFDFRRVQPGDRFRVVYERRVRADGHVLAPGKVLAAEIGSGNRVVQAFYYDDGVEGIYVAPDGRVLSQSFLRYPVEFTRISSHFSHRRFHPILKRSRPHNGVDFAAPRGTPVRAASDGIVSWAGRMNGFGNHVALQHGDGVVTTYSHLDGIARGVLPGAAIRQGRVIGWVGQTGLATGPHLHFALFRNGLYIDPLTTKLPLRRTVGDRQRFELAKADLLVQLASTPRPPTGAPVEPVMLAALPASRRLGVVTITQ